MWSLGIELRTSGRAVNALICWAISPVTQSTILTVPISFLLTCNFLFLKIYLFNICEYIVAVFRHSRRGCQISLLMVVSYHVVAGDWTRDFSFFLSFCFKLIYSMYMDGYNLALSSNTPEEVVRYHYTDGCEPPCGFWELNSEPLEEQSVLLTTEPNSPAQYFFNL